MDNPIEQPLPDARVADETGVTQAKSGTESPPEVPLSLTEVNKTNESDRSDERGKGEEAVPITQIDDIKQKRCVSFPVDNNCVTGYKEPPNPWKNGTIWTTSELVAAYRKGCEINNVKPLSKLLNQLQGIEDTRERFEIISLKGEKLDQRHCESLEELLRRVQFKTIDLEGTHLDDETAVALFDMIEYYDSACRLNISFNKNIAIRGWQACSKMIRKTPSLTYLDARNCELNERLIPILGRSLKLGALLTTLHLENTYINGRSLVILVAALKMNEILLELFLADNKLMPSDGIQLGNLLKYNQKLQLLDVRNNHLQDVGLSHLCGGLSDQNLGIGLNTLVLWNNQITYQSMGSLSRTLCIVEALETLNVGHNNLTNEGMHRLKEGLLKNKSLLRIGLQGTKITCEGSVALAEYIADSPNLMRLDLRENDIKTAGLMALSLSLRVSQTVVRLDLDKDNKKESGMKDYAEQQRRLKGEINTYLERNYDNVRRKEEEEKQRILQKQAESIEEKTPEESVESEAEEAIIAINDVPYIPSYDKIQRPKLLFALQTSPQQSLESPVVGSEDFDCFASALGSNSVGNILSPAPEELLLSPQYSSIVTAKKLFTVNKVMDNVSSGLAAAAQGHTTPYIPSLASEYMVHPNDLSLSQTNYLSEIALDFENNPSSVSELRQHLVSESVSDLLRSISNDDIDVSRLEMGLVSEEAQTIEKCESAQNSENVSGVVIENVNANVNENDSSELSSSQKSSEGEITCAMNDEHASSSDVANSSAVTDFQTCENGMGNLELSRNEDSEKQSNHAINVQEAEVNGCREGNVASLPGDSKRESGNGSYEGDNNWTHVNTDTSKANLVKDKVDGNKPDFYTSLTMNGMTKELASLLDDIDCDMLATSSDNGNEDMAAGDLTDSPDNFEKELDAVLASVRKSHYLPLTGHLATTVEECPLPSNKNDESTHF